MSTHIQAYLVLFHFIILCRFCDFFQIDDYGNPALSKASGASFFSDTIFLGAFAYFIFLSCVNNSYNISNLSLMLYVVVICDQ